MTTHDRDKIITAAKKAEITYSGAMPEIFDSQDMLTSFYTIAFEAGRQAEREETNRRPLPDNTAPYIRARGDTK